MICAWQDFLMILPQWIRSQMDQDAADELRELRLRIGHNPELVLNHGIRYLPGDVRSEDLNYCMNTASHYSPWAAQTISKGYITASGGHRIGFCGDATVEKGKMVGMKSVRSACIRIARDFPGIASSLDHCNGSILLIGPPGSGKTTMLRDLARRRSLQHQMAVVDERGEIFPECFMTGKQEHLDVLSGCPKTVGIEMMIRTMGPTVIAVDEITARADCNALTEAAWCGIKLLATVHAADRSDLSNRQSFRSILDHKVFDWIISMQRDMTWKAERVYI